MRLLFAAVALAAFGCAHAPPAGPSPLTALRLEAVGPSAYAPGELAGKVVLVDFFATYCFPCLAELPALIELQKKYGPKGFTVVAVGMDLDGAKVIDPFARYYALPFPVTVADEWIRSGESPFGRIHELPTTFVLDRQGRTLAAFAGVAAPEQLDRLVARAVE